MLPVGLLADFLLAGLFRVRESTGFWLVVVVFEVVVVVVVVDGLAFKAVGFSDFVAAFLVVFAPDDGAVAVADDEFVVDTPLPDQADDENTFVLY